MSYLAVLAERTHLFYSLQAPTALLVNGSFFWSLPRPPLPVVEVIVQHSPKSCIPRLHQRKLGFPCRQCKAKAPFHFGILGAAAQLLEVVLKAFRLEEVAIRETQSLLHGRGW